MSLHRPAAATLLLLLPSLAYSQLPTTAPAAATTQPRDEQSIITDLRATNEALTKIMPAIPAIADADFRQKNGPEALPLLQKMTTLFQELEASQTDPATQQKIAADRYLFTALRVALGDPQAAATLKTDAATPGPTALDARSALALGTWWKDSKDPAAQAKDLDAYATVAKDNPTSDRVAITLATMSNLGPATPELAARAVDIMHTTLTGDAAKQILASIDGERALKDMVGKPLVVAGRTVNGSQFTSADWKGKVILVDFWATWCGPCNAELPRTKELYTANHPKGLEMVGVDCDDSDATVIDFTKSHDMPWPQLRETSQNGDDSWSPLAKQWHVTGIPTMFLIDKKGILRFVDARENTDEKVAQLLAETP